MFVDNGPAAAAAAIQDYLILNMANVPEPARAKLLVIARERLPADIIVKGVDLLYSALTQCAMPNPNDGWSAVGTAALHLGNSNYWGRGERGYTLSAHANAVLTGGSLDNAPALDPEYTIVVEEPEEPEAPPTPPGFVPPGPAPA